MSILNIKRVVIKVGTSTLTHNTGLINLRRIELLSRTLCDLKNRGIDVVLVSSGAIGVGVGKLGLCKKPTETRDKQAVAAVGQVELMNIYSKMFGDYGVSVAQVLLTKDVLNGDERQTNARNTFDTLLELGVVPIVNENDTISVYEIEFGDNDTLSAYVAKLIEADLLVILSDIEGLYDSDPRTHSNAKLIEYVGAITDDIRSLAGGAGSSLGTGGMLTKIDAAQITTKAGISTIITNGEDPQVLYDIIDGKSRGTFFDGGKK